MEEKIDFVITWVDGNDKNWIIEKERFQEKKENDSNRFRDWDNLKYWFRAVEQFAPWVNRIFFVTWGHVPTWLNTNHPKLKILRHEDYIPQEYLPTFNSNVIELNLHRVKELSEQFVLFNDDFFLCKPLEKSDFFKEGIPCEEFSENINMPKKYHNAFSHIALNNIGIVNEHFNKKEVYRKHLGKYFNWHYGLNNVRTFLLLPWPMFAQFRDPHLPVALLKSTLEKLWKIEPEAFETTSQNRFRHSTDVNQYLIRYWQLLEGNFHPRSSKIGRYFEIARDNTKLLEAIRKQKCKMICLNDVDTSIDFEKTKQEIQNAFDKILPRKSNFEKV